MEELCNLYEKFIYIPGALNKYYVHVTYINDPNDFYVRPTAYDKYMPQLECPGQKVGKSDMYLGQVVVFFSKQKKKYVRGRVVGIDNEVETYNLHTIDYGDIEKNIPLEIVKTTQFATIPGLAQQCSLECGSIGPTWSEKSIEAMKYHVDAEECPIRMTIFKKFGAKLIVSLDTNPDIGLLLIMTGHASFVQTVP